ncbi:MAG TPA: hypothetical protein VNY24_09710 [Candidatus Acidoferrales bacterium]|nr:hypothetical protein [Candidatus Acidoferrales bacterium]
MLLKNAFRTPLFFSRILALWLAVLAIPALVSAQQPSGGGTSTAPATRPDSPQPKQEASPRASGGSNRFVGYVTSRSIVFPDIATNPRPLSPAGKFKIFVNQAISPAYVLGSGVSAAVNQANNSPGSTGQGWDAYGTRVGYSMGRASSTSFFGTFVFASILRQDPRFFPESHPGFIHAIKYSAVRIVVTRNDKGKDVFNSSGLLGPLAAEALSNAYLPRSEQTGARSMERYGSDLAWRFAANIFKEYWPTIFRDMHLQKVMPNPGNGGQP